MHRTLSRWSSAGPAVAISNQKGAAAQTLSAAQILAGQGKSGPLPGVQRLLSEYHKIPPQRSRIFAIIAHIDHGKSTLSDALLEHTQNIHKTAKGHQQVLDTLEVERKRGITVKAQSASMIFDYQVSDGEKTLPGFAEDSCRDYLTGVGASSLMNAAMKGQVAPPKILQQPPKEIIAAAPVRVPHLINLVDTPGHVDFSYEVGRSLAACDGALLLIDAGQGVQAQTVANFNAAKEAGLTVVPVLTKIDLAIADPEPILSSLEGLFGLDPETAIWTSAKSGAGIKEVLPAVIERIPPPAMSEDVRNKPAKALLFDAWADPYRGVVCSVLVVEGVLKPGDSITACHSGEKFTIQELGLMAPAKIPVGTIAEVKAGGSLFAAQQQQQQQQMAASNSVAGGLGAGCIGYAIMGMKNAKQAQVGDTFISTQAIASGQTSLTPLSGFKPAKPVVFASLYPVDSGDFSALCAAVDRLTLNDSSVTVEKESSSSLGFGLRCGFLGLLHMDVFQQRLQSEHDTAIIVTNPMVRYRLEMENGETMICERAGDFPSSHLVRTYHEPTALVSIMTPSHFVSPLMGLLADRRGVQVDLMYLNSASSGSASTVFAAPEGATAEAAAAASSGADDLSAAADSLEGEDDNGDDDDDRDDEEDDDDEEDELKESKCYSSSSSAPPVATVLSPEALGDRVVLKYRVPWAEVVTNLYDAVKSISAGYASMDFSPSDYQRADIVKVDLLLNGKPVDALCFVAHKDKALSEGRRLCGKLKKLIDRQQFEIIIQAAVGNKIFARERIAPYRKDVLASGKGTVIGGGDRTRKQKLLQKQKEGKAKMKTVGNVQLSQQAFHALLKGE